ncbi:stage II sporulation protein M [Paraliobacillus zengyii]|uniref:stage II sporulation protein M n=1 Tax=Paraliobacillus zengyii TaxID=2213194 RepID=UPI000DD445DD|nr:stage II sporulation protein M [Paraliobacillus zengyii]
MQLKQFIQQHRKDWQELEQLTSDLQKRNQITSTTIDKFDHLYQKAAQNLSYCQTYYPNEEVTGYLNGMVSKAHNVLYQKQQSSWKQLHYFFSTKFVGLLLDQWKPIVIAMLLFFFGGLASFLSVLDNPLHINGILPNDMAQSIADPSELEENAGSVNASLMSAEIMTNNIRVAILAFAGGITFGLLTIYLLIYNGVIIGALAALFWNSGNSYIFWAYIVPHGIIELLAIFIAGGAGLLMGYKLFVPGNLSRLYQLKIQTIRSVQLLLGTIPIFILAGIIEGFITPADLSLEIKYVVALLTLIGFILYMVVGHFFLQKRPT